jgi:hypothetical protein
MSGGSSSYVAGYRYFFGIHMGVCRSGDDGVDELVEARVGDRTAWAGSVTSNQTVAVDAYNLFGGEDGEGGVQGNMWVLMGGSAQLAPDELAEMTSGDVTQVGNVPAEPSLYDVTAQVENLYGSISQTAASVVLRFAVDGTLQVVLNGTNGARTDSLTDQWVNRYGESVQVSLTPSDFEVRVATVSGPTPNIGDTLNTWLSLSTQREFGISGIGSVTVVSAEVRQISTGASAFAQYTLVISDISNPGGA